MGSLSDLFGSNDQLPKEYTAEQQAAPAPPGFGWFEGERPSEANSGVQGPRRLLELSTLDDPTFGVLQQLGTSAVLGPLGGELGGAMGLSGNIGQAVGSGLVNGGMNLAQGGSLSDAAKAGLASGIGSYANGIGLDKMAGISDPTLGRMFNKGAGSALSTAIRGGSLKDSLTSGLTSAGTTGLNFMGKTMGNSFRDLWDSFSSPQTDGFAYSSNPAENASYPEGALSSSRQNYYNILDQQPPQATMPSGEMNSPSPFNNSGFNFSSMSGSPSGMKTAQSAGDSGGGGLSSFLPSGSQVGNFLGSHGGDLASMLYGFYNNRKQQQALQGQQEGLQGLYGQNSPYAQQLRAKLDAHGAAMGTRLNTGGREVQLQAMLADRAAHMAPYMYQMQQGQQGLQNKNLDILKMGFDKLGGGQALNRGLQNLFKPQASLTGPGSMEAYGNMDNMYSNMPWGG